MTKEIVSARWLFNEEESALVFYSDGSVEGVGYSEGERGFQELKAWRDSGKVIEAPGEVTPIDGLTSLEKARDTVAKITRCGCRDSMAMEDWNLNEMSDLSEEERAKVKQRDKLICERDEKIEKLNKLSTMQEIREFLLTESCHYACMANKAEKE